jgi:hypothetical protein
MECIPSRRSYSRVGERILWCDWCVGAVPPASADGVITLYLLRHENWKILLYIELCNKA